MPDRLEDRKIVLIAFPSEEQSLFVEDAVRRRFKEVTFFRAGDGFETWSKMENVPPHIVIMPGDLPKLDPIRLMNNTLGDKRFEQTALIIVSSVPETQMFVDEIVSGRLHFIEEFTEENLGRAVTRSFNHISAAQRSDFRLLFLGQNERLIKEGEKATHVYLVRSGRLEASNHRTEKLVLGFVEAGEFVGEMAYINGEARSADVTALTDCELIEIPIEHLDHYLYRKPAWSKALMITLSKRLKKANHFKA